MPQEIHVLIFGYIVGFYMAWNIGANDVANTIRKGIVSTDILTDPHLVLIGALSAMLAAALWVNFATWKSLPVSTTHSIGGAMIGFGIIAGGFSVINRIKLAAVIKLCYIGY